MSNKTFGYFGYFDNYRYLYIIEINILLKGRSYEKKIFLYIV